MIKRPNVFFIRLGRLFRANEKLVNFLRRGMYEEDLL